MSGDLIPGPADNQSVFYQGTFYLIVALIVAGFTSIMQLMEQGNTYGARVVAVFTGLCVFAVAGYVAEYGLRKAGLEEK